MKPCLSTSSVILSTDRWTLALINGSMFFTQLSEK